MSIWFRQSGLTQTVVSIMGQHESIVAGAPVVAWNVDAFMDTSPIVVVLTLIHIWKKSKVLLLLKNLWICLFAVILPVTLKLCCCSIHTVRGVTEVGFPLSEYIGILPVDFLFQNEIIHHWNHKILLNSKLFLEEVGWWRLPLPLPSSSPDQINTTDASADDDDDDGNDACFVRKVYLRLWKPMFLWTSTLSYKTSITVRWGMLGKGAFRWRVQKLRTEPYRNPTPIPCQTTGAAYKWLPCGAF